MPVPHLRRRTGAQDAPHLQYRRSNPRPTTDLVKALESSLGRTAQIEHLPPQPGDVSLTYADTSALEAAYDYKPVVKLEDGIARFADWYLGWRGDKARSLAS